MPVTSVILKKNSKFAMYESDFKEGMKEICYINGKPPVFQMTFYDIKAGKFV